MSGDLVGDDTVFYVLLIRQSEMLFGWDVAEHRCAVPANHRRANRRRDVVVSRRNVGHERAQRVEGSFIAVFVFQFHLLLDLVHRYVAGAFDHDLDIMFPGNFREFAEGFEFGKLGFVAGVGDAAGTQAIAEREADIILRENLADVLEAFVEKILLVVVGHPLREDSPAATDDACNALGNHREILDKYAGMDGHVVHTLGGLLLDHFEHDARVEVFDALYARNRFVDGNRADGYGRMPQNGVADFMNSSAGREVHHRVGAVVHRGVQLLQFFLNIGSDRWI